MSKSQTTSNEDMTVVFIGTRTTEGRRQLVYSVNDEILFVPADTRNFLAGERVVGFAKTAIDMYEKAVKQGLIEVN